MCRKTCVQTLVVGAGQTFNILYHGTGYRKIHVGILNGLLDLSMFVTHPFLNAKGHVHTNTFSFENAYFSLCFGLLSTLRFFKTVYQSGYIWKRHFRVVVWTVKTEAYENVDACLVMKCILYQ